jgi:hypothetical protein
VYESCPYCGKNVIYDSERCEIVCPHCGLVIDDRPLVSTSSSRNEDGGRKGRKHRRRRPVLISTDAWLRAGLEIVRDLYMRVFSDTCTFETAERILSEIYQNVPRRKLPNYEHAAKFAVLVASRRCNEFVELEKLFKSVSEVYELLRHDYLHKLYAPPDRASQIKQLAMRIAKCLEKRGVQVVVVVDEVRLDRDRLCTISAKPLNLAVALVYSTLKKRAIAVDLAEIAECAGTRVNAIKNAIERYSRIF